MNNEFRGKNLKINGSTDTSIFDIGHSLIDILYTFAHAEFFERVIQEPILRWKKNFSHFAVVGTLRILALLHTNRGGW